MDAVMPPTADCSEPTCAVIRSVLWPVESARDLTSWATTAKPRPSSPARAASMVALSARSRVCDAIRAMRSTTAPISRAVASRDATAASVPEASATAPPAEDARPEAEAPSSTAAAASCSDSAMTVASNVSAVCRRVRAASATSAWPWAMRSRAVLIVVAPCLKEPVMPTVRNSR